MTCNGVSASVHLHKMSAYLCRTPFRVDKGLAPPTPPFQWDLIWTSYICDDLFQVRLRPEVPAVRASTHEFVGTPVGGTPLLDAGRWKDVWIHSLCHNPDWNASSRAFCKWAAAHQQDRGRISHLPGEREGGCLREMIFWVLGTSFKMRPSLMKEISTEYTLLFFNNCTYFWPCWVFLATHGLSLSRGEWELLSGCGVWASHCGGFSGCGTQALGIHGLQELWHKLLLGMWVFPDPNSCLLNRQAGVCFVLFCFITEPPGTPLNPLWKSSLVYP